MSGGWAPIVVTVATVVVLGLGGGLLTDIGPWYRNLRKPSFQPPDWLFGPAWTVIYATTGTAAVLAWNGAPDPHTRTIVGLLFGLNALLNFLWSPLFFKLRRPDLALIEVVPLFLSVLALVVVVGRITTLGGWLMVPYLVWTAFATVLNWTIVRLNPRVAA